MTSQAKQKKQRGSYVRRVFVTGALSLAVSGIAMGLPQAAHAEDNFPSKPITLVVPFGAGGSSDMLGRVIARALSTELKQQVIVENKGGAGGTIGAASVARAAPDGYTLLLSNVGLTSASALYKNLPYEFSKDMSAISLLGQVPFVLVVNKDIPAKDGKAFLEYLKDNNGKVNYGSPGVGAASHLATVSFLNAANADAVHVPYKGMGQMMVDLMAGNVHFAIDTAGSAFSQIRGGNVSGLAVTSAERVPTFPDLPTVKELGVPFEIGLWYGISAPAGVSPSVQKKLHAAVEKATTSKEVVEAYASMGMQLDTRGGKEFQDVIEADKERWVKLVQDAGIQPN